MLMTRECPGLDKTSVDVLVKVEANLLFICNDCADKNKKQKFTQQTEEEHQMKNDLKELKEQMLYFRQYVEKYKYLTY